MGLYGTLGLVGALALSALLAVWLFYSRSRREDFPEDTWDPYLGKKEDTDEGPGEGVEDISGAPGRAGVAPLSSRLQGLEAIPSNVEEEAKYEEKVHREADLIREQRTAERAGEAVELIGGEPIPPGGAEEAGEGALYGAGRGEAGEETGAPVPAQGDIGLPDLGGGGIGGVPAPPPPSGKIPWWEGVSSPGDVPFRRTVAELMGVAIADPPPRKSVVAHFPGLSDEEIAPEKGEATPLPDISREISLAAEDAAAGDESVEDGEISLSEPSDAPEEGEAAPLPDISLDISLAAEDAATGDEPAEPPAPVSLSDEVEPVSE
ncbi:MAG: hypothetical protein V3V56_08000, partial [bacterium]